MIDAVIKGILVGLFMAISVGPTIFVIIRYSLNFSYKAGLAFVLGVSMSDIIYVTLANVAARWLDVLKPYERYLGFGGAIVLIVIGLVGIIKKHKPIRPSSNKTPVTGGHYVRFWISGFLVNTLNPGVLITWLGIVTLTATSSGFYRFILFGTCLVLILSIDFLKVFLADRIKRLLTMRRVIYMQRISAACIFLIGVSLLISTILNANSKPSKEKSNIDKVLSYHNSKGYHQNLSPNKLFNLLTN